MNPIEELLSGNADLKVMNWFSSNPRRSVYVNELSKIIDLSNASCSRVLNKLEENGILKRTKLGNSHHYELIDNYATREMKRFFIIMKIFGSGVVEHLKNEHPSLTNLVLYGSCSTGEYDEKSDIDLLAISNDRLEEDLSTFEDLLGKSIQITSVNIGKWIDMKETGSGFCQEVIKDGIVLHGGELP